MTTTMRGRRVFTATEQERAEIRRISRALADEPGRAKLAGPKGDEMFLSGPLFEVLERVAESLTRGEAVAVIPIHQQLTTNQAAELLNVSRQYLVRLLDEGKIPFDKTGTHRRIRVGDLMEFKEQRDERRRQTLSEMTRRSQEMGLYDVDINEVECHRSPSS